MKQHVTNKSCWFFHNIWWKVCFKRIFLSWIWFFKPRMYPASWAKHFPSTAQLAGSLLAPKNHTHEGNIIFKQTFHQILWKNQQLSFMTCCLIFLPYSPYYICSKLSPKAQNYQILMINCTPFQVTVIIAFSDDNSDQVSLG